MGQEEAKKVVVETSTEEAAPPPPVKAPAKSEKNVAEEKSVNSPLPEEKPDDLKSLANVEKSTDPSTSSNSIDRDAVLARVEIEKRISLIRAWEESEKVKAENKMYPSSFKKRRFDQEIMDLSDPFAIARRIDELNEEKYGSATKEFEELHAWRMKFINILPPYHIKPCPKPEPQSLQTSLNANCHRSLAAAVIEVDSDSEADAVNPTVAHSDQYESHFYTPAVVRKLPSIQYEKVSFGEKADVQVNKSPKSMVNHSRQMLQSQNDVKEEESDGLEDLWNDMDLAIQSSKGIEPSVPVQKEDDCCHDFILNDEIGIVCRICGLIQKSIDTIWDFHWTKS